MSWFGNLVNAYDRVSDRAGVADTDGHVLLPLYHMMANTDICITLNENGEFLRAEESPLSIPIPCTESSSTRTGGAVPHPLHEQLVYLAIDVEKRNSYISLLQSWRGNHPKVKAVYEYIQANTVFDDLKSSNIVLDDKSGKFLARFRVEIINDKYPNLWEDLSVSRAWQEHVVSANISEETLCYIQGTAAPYTVKHPKGTNMNTYGAKLVSCNDETNYTYKGRFKKPEHANAISVEASQKAHAMLKYLVAKHGHKCDTQAIVAWAIDDVTPQLNPFSSTDSLMFGIDSYITEQPENDTEIEAAGNLYTDYSANLRQALLGKGSAKNLEKNDRRVAVMAMDAATTGRMGITFYQDMDENDYITRIIRWHETCSWRFRYKGWYTDAAPSANRIIAVVFGEPKGKNYYKIQKQAREQLLYNIVCGQPLDRSWISAAVTRVSQPLAYDSLYSYQSKERWITRGTWEHALGVTCAIVRKHYQKEGFTLALDKTNADRSYLFGRLLAIADKIESHARYQQGASDTEKRPTNAIRYMSAFSTKPLRTWKLIFNQLNPYIQRLNGAGWYQQQIDEVMSLFTPDGFNDAQLDGKYLLGYSLQRLSFKKDNQEDEK